MVALPGVAEAEPGATSLTITSEPGDFIGQGVDRHFTPADGSFYVHHEPGVVEVSFDGGPEHYWVFELVAPDGDELVPGPYRGATRHPFQSPARPGISVSAEARGCNTLTGRFQVLEADYGAGGSVERFAADFEQHCEGDAPALRGSIRFQASSTFPPPPDGDGDTVADTVDNCPEVANPSQVDGDRDGLGDACDGTSTITALRTVSEPGESIGQGIEGTRHPDEGPFVADSMDGVRIIVYGGTYNHWELFFSAPVGEELRPGIYEGATRTAYRAPNEPGLTVNSYGRGCGSSIGRFEILEVAYGADGGVERFAADFEQRCDGATELLRGQVRVDASAAYALPPVVGKQTTTAFCANLHYFYNPFDDDGDSIFEAVIECLAYAGVTSGGPGGTGPRQYGPDLAVSRGQMASFIARELDTAERLGTGHGVGRLQAFDGSNDFPDVPAGNVHLEAINRLAQAGIALGGPGGRSPAEFGPNLPVSREQMASFINRSHELLTGATLAGSGDHFSDDDGSSHEANIEAMATAGIAVGDGRGSYGPARVVTRGQMAAFLVRHLAVVQESGQIIPLRG